jgi:hypothetical protein
MKSTTEGFEELYEMIAGKKPVFENPSEWENFDKEFEELLQKEDIPAIKAKMTKIENLNIFEGDFKILEKIPASWNVIYTVLNKYYSIGVVAATPKA